MVDGLKLPSNDNAQLEAEGYTAACKTQEVPAMMPRRVQIQGRGVLVCRHRMKFFAVDEICPHKYKSMAHGLVQAGELICPHHQYRFNVETGICRTRRCAPVEVYEVAVSGDQVFVKVPPRGQVASDSAAAEDTAGSNRGQ